MVWNKTPGHIVENISSSLQDFSKRYEDIAKENNVSKSVVTRIANTFPSEWKKERYSKINHYAKLKTNPMTGKTGMQHHNAVEISYKAGYRTVWAPDWWKGFFVSPGRVYEHQLVWAEQAKTDRIPEGCVIHHIDENKDNNSPDNLICLTRRQHAQIHCVNNLSQSATTIPIVGVENSILEAQRLLLKEHDIV